MPSTYTPNLRLELQATGENRATWGIKANQVFSDVDAAIAGTATIAMGNADYTLSAMNGSPDEARCMFIEATGANTAVRSVIVPSVSKVFVVKNGTTGGFAINVRTSTGGTQALVSNGRLAFVLCDGTVCSLANDELPASLQSIAGLTTTADQTLYTTGANVYATTSLTSFARTNILNAANGAAILTAIGGVPTTRTVSAGTGLTGGGDLSANRSFSVVYGTTAGTAAQGNDARFGYNSTPVGSVIMVYGNGTDTPPGYLLMNGFSVTSTYPELRAFGLANGWATDGSGDPICPDMGGYFPRGWRSGQVIDSGRVFGTSQADALQDHDHNLPNGAAQNNTGSVYARGAGGSSLTQISGPVNGARTSTETRPYNMTFTFWIKAYPAIVDTSSINLSQLTNDINAVSVRTTALETKVGGGAVGVGQTWQNVAGGRLIGTSYQNTTGRSIQVNVTVQPGTSAVQPMLQISQDNLTWIDVSRGLNGTDYLNGSAVVPSGHYYRVNVGVLIVIWAELR